MNIDRFKLVNDTLGHVAGDQLLRQFAGRLLEVSPPGALLARLGGDEFAALIEHDALTSGQVEAICRRIVGAVKAPFKLSQEQVHVGVSIGVAWRDPDLNDVDDLFRRASIALASMKANGRGDFLIYSDEMELAIRSRAALEDALRRTISSGVGLSLAYQPKVNRSGRIQGVEALLRWSMDGQAVSPAVFIPIAEEAGLIGHIGEWVISQAIDFSKRWPNLSIAVNLSPAQLNDPDFPKRLLFRVQEEGVNPDALELEVTETTLFESTGIANGALLELREAGIKVALDDFGTGFSSLGHLHSVTVDRVKIDQSFVAGLDRGIEAGVIISAVIQLAHSMGLQVTAEGVETIAQRDFLLDAGVDEFQGYLFSGALPECDLYELLGTRD